MEWGRTGEPSYIEVLQQRAGNLNIRRLLLVKGNQITQVKELLFYVWEDARVWFTEITLLICDLVTWGQSSEFPRGSLWLQSDDC